MPSNDFIFNSEREHYINIVLTICCSIYKIVGLYQKIIKFKTMLNLIDRNLKSITQKQIGNGVNIKHLDASCNQLSRGIEFKPLSNLVTLVVDDNKFTCLTDFPIFKQLETFSANKNNFSDLSLFLEEALDRFGCLKNLSALKNPINPFFEGEQKYIIFRDQILQKFPQLQTLDGCAVVIMKKQKLEKQKKQEDTYEKLQAFAAYDPKYASNDLKTVKTRSVGHRFIKNNEL